MVKARLAVAAWSAALLAAGFVTAAVLAAPAAGAAGICGSAGECYLAAVTPSSVAAGDSQAFTVTITNESSETLASAQVTAPTGFVVTGASGGTASSTPGSAQFLNLGVQQNQSVALTVVATAPCGATTSAWGIQASEAGGSDSDGDFQLVQPSSLSATVSGNCHLAFHGQPHDTMIGKTITTNVGSTGNPVTVDVLDGANNVLTSSSAQVTMGIGSNPGPGTLSGHKIVNAVAGVATFGDLSIDKAGTGYTLAATSPGITSATSSQFNMWPVLQPCTSGSCSGTTTTTTTTGTVTGSPGSTNEFLAVGLGGAGYSCGSYQPLSDLLTFDIFSPAGTSDPGAIFTDVLKISKSVVKSSGHPGASSWQICYASQQTFTAVTGTGGTVTIDGVFYHTGLLPDCSSKQSAPCVQARNKDNAGNVIVRFLAVGDPKAWM